LYLAFVLNNFGFTIGRLSTGSLWGLMVMTTGKPHPAQAWMQSYYETAGNVARIFGPVICIAAYTAVELRTFVFTAILGVMSLVVVVFGLLKRASILQMEPPAAAASSASPAVEEKRVGTVRAMALTFLVVATNFSFGLPLPSLKALVEESSSDHDAPGLGQSAAVYAWMVALFSIGCLLGAIFAGWIHTKFQNFQVTALTLNVCGLCGGVLCGISTSIWVLAVGRFAVGFWMGGMNVVFRSYLTANVAKKYIAQFFAASAFFCALAWAISPAVGSGLAALPPVVLNSALRFDKYRSPGWIIAALSIMCLGAQRLL
jgi:hypothetical protein